MWSFNAISTCILVVALGGVFVLVLLVRQQRSQRDTPIWLLAGLVGVLLGASAAAAVIELSGYERTDQYATVPPPSAADLQATAAGNPSPGGGAGGGMGMGGGMGGGGMGMGGGGMGMGGGGFAPSPKRQLTTLVRKLELLTGDIKLELSAEQTFSVNSLLAGIEDTDTMTDEAAEEKYNALLALLDEEQQATEQSVSLPRRRRGGGGPGGFGGGPEDAEANPFQQEENAQALVALRARLAGEAAGNDDGSADPGTVNDSE